MCHIVVLIEGQKASLIGLWVISRKREMLISAAELMELRYLAIKPFFYTYQIVVICSNSGRQAIM